MAACDCGFAAPEHLPRDLVKGCVCGGVLLAPVLQYAKPALKNLNLGKLLLLLGAVVVSKFLMYCLYHSQGV